MIRSILVSLAVTSLMSLLCSVLFSNVFGYSFVKCVLVAFVGQIVGYYIWSSFLTAITRTRIEQEQTKQVELFSQQGVDVSCAYCNTTNFIPIRMDDVNQFKCESCDKPNSVYIDVTVAQQTTPLNRESLKVNLHNKEKQDATKRVQGE